MKTCVQQFFDPHQRETVLSPVVRELPWNNQVIALTLFQPHCEGLSVAWAARPCSRLNTGEPPVPRIDRSQSRDSYLWKSAKSADSKSIDPQMTQISADGDWS